MSTNGKETAKLFGVKIDKVDFEEAYMRFDGYMRQDETKMIFTPNAEIIMKAQDDPEFKTVLNKGDLVIPDGIGIVIASKIHHLGLKERVTGIDMMERILEYCNRSKSSIFIFGGKPGVAETAVQNIEDKFSNIKIKGVLDGYYDEKDELKILDRINEEKPDVLFVALGAPKQEKWIEKHQKFLNVKVAMGVGGAVDVYAGVAKRAPLIMRKLGLEWLYRLVKEPSRFGRMLVLPKFLLKVIFSKPSPQK